MTTPISRRAALGAGLTLPAASLLAPSLGQAQTAAPARQAPGFYLRRVGDLTVTALLDGYIDVADDFWTGIEQAELDAATAAAFLPDRDFIRIGVTSYLVEGGGRKTLIDTGSADLFGPTAGRFAQSLADAGTAPDEIDDVLITHMHPDHIGALIEAGGPALPRAALHVAAEELDFWTSTSARAGAPDFAKPWFDAARAVRGAYGDAIAVFEGEAPVLPGIVAVPLPGHTPGHTGFRVSSAGDELLVWGDASGVAAVQFAHPEAGLVFDVDGETGRRTRLRLLDMAAAEGVAVASAHLPFPSFGHVARRGTAFAWVPEEYRFDL